MNKRLLLAIVTALFSLSVRAQHIVYPANNQVIQQWPNGTDITVQFRGAATAAQLQKNGAVVANAQAGNSGRPTVFKSVAPGWYDLVLANGQTPVDSIKVGVGDVFIAGGQSNAISQPQPAGYVPVLPASGRVILSDYYGAGGGMHAFVDAAAGNLSSGIAWVYTGMYLNRPWPVMFVIIAKGNTSYYDWATASQAPGVPDNRIWRAWADYLPKAFLWIQGESECTFPVPRTDSYLYLNAIIDGVRQVTAIPWIMAINSTSYPPPQGYSEWPVRAAQRQVIANWPHVKEGPNLDGYRSTGDVEFLGISPTGDQLRNVGEAFARSIIEYGL